MSFTRQQRSAKTTMAARSWLSSGKYQVETPRCKMVCAECEQEVERLTPVWVGPVNVWLCDSCKGKKGTK